MAQYTVRAGDTLLGIAERCYGHGYLWQQLADCNPLARAGVLYQGQRLELPPLSPLPSLADGRRLAQPVGHLPVRIKLDGSGPLFRFDGFGAFAIVGLVGELTFHRHGALPLSDLSPNRLLAYRLEQLRWAQNVFQQEFCGRAGSTREFEMTSTGPVVPRIEVQRAGPGFTVLGNVGEWRVVSALAPRHVSWRCTVALRPATLFQAATLVLDEDPPSGVAQDHLLPLGRVLRAACPQEMSSTSLWVLTRDRTCLSLGQTVTFEPITAANAGFDAAGEAVAEKKPIRKPKQGKLRRAAKKEIKKKARKEKR
jgi:LysM domain-containing protein